MFERVVPASQIGLGDVFERKGLAVRVVGIEQLSAEETKTRDKVILHVESIPEGLKLQCRMNATKLISRV